MKDCVSWPYKSDGENHFLHIVVFGVLENRWVGESFEQKKDIFRNISLR